MCVCVCVYVCVYVCVCVSLSFCSLCGCPSFPPFFHLPTSYLSIVITLLLLLLQLCLLILQLWVFLRNHVGESSKQGIEVQWSTPIHQVK